MNKTRLFATTQLADKSLQNFIKLGRKPPSQSHLDNVLRTIKNEEDFVIGARSVRRAAAAKVIRTSTPMNLVNQQRTSSLLSLAGTRSGQAKRVLEIFNARNEWSKMTLTSGAASYLFDHAATLSTIIPTIPVDNTKGSKETSKSISISSPLSPAAAFAEEVHALARTHGVIHSRSYTYSGVTCGLKIGGKSGYRLAMRIAMEGSKAPFHDGAVLRLLGVLWTGKVVEKTSNKQESDGNVISRLSLLRLAELQFLHTLVTSLAKEEEREGRGKVIEGEAKSDSSNSNKEKVRPAVILARFLKEDCEKALEKSLFDQKLKSQSSTTGEGVSIKEIEIKKLS
jgi:hypothetical protein